MDVLGLGLVGVSVGLGLLLEPDGLGLPPSVGVPLSVGLGEVVSVGLADDVAVGAAVRVSVGVAEGESVSVGEVAGESSLGEADRLVLSEVSGEAEVLVTDGLLGLGLADVLLLGEVLVPGDVLAGEGVLGEFDGEVLGDAEIGTLLELVSVGLALPLAVADTDALASDDARIPPEPESTPPVRAAVNVVPDGRLAQADVAAIALPEVKIADTPPVTQSPIATSAVSAPSATGLTIRGLNCAPSFWSALSRRA